MCGHLWRPTLELHLKIKVFLLDLNHGDQRDDGRLFVQPPALERTLHEALPFYNAPVVPSASMSRQSRAKRSSNGIQDRPLTSSPLEVRYNVSYSVNYASKEFLSDFVNDLTKRARISLEGGIRTWLLPIDVVSEAVEAMLIEYGMASELINSTFGSSEITVLVVSPRQTNKLSSRLGGLADNPKARDQEKPELLPYRFVEPDQVEQATPTTAAHSYDDSNERHSWCTSSWVGRSKTLFLDLGAVGCEYEVHSTPTKSGPLTGDVPLAVPALSSPENWLHITRKNFGLKKNHGLKQAMSRAGSGGGSPDLATFFNLQLTSYLVSAMRTTLAPAVPTAPGPGDISDVVMIPLIVFRGVDRANKVGVADAELLEEGSLALDNVNVTHVSRVVNAMALPGQEVVIVGAAHSLSEHPQVAVALEKSFATKRVMDVKSGRKNIHPQLEVLPGGYIDGDRLLLEMRSAGDMLASSLLSDIRADSVLRLDVALAAGYMDQGSTRVNDAVVRVLPVFVFCMEDLDEPLLDTSTSSAARNPKRDRPASFFEGGSHFWAEAGGDAVLVIHSESGAATQPVTSGLLRALHGANAPDHWWSWEQQGPVLDLSWARGHHPFAPYGFAGCEPGELFVDVARRNAFTSRAAVVAATLFEAADTLEDLAESALTSELLSSGRRMNLCPDGAATQQVWGRAFEDAAMFGGLPEDRVLQVVGVHTSLREAVVSFESQLWKAKESSLADAIAAMDVSRSNALAVLDLAVEVANELQWCECTFARSTKGPHTPWMLFVVFLLASLYGLVRVVAVGRRIMLKYLGSFGPEPGY